MHGQMEGDGKMLESAIKQQLKSELTRVQHLIRITKERLNRIGELPDGTMVCCVASPTKLNYYRQIIKNGKKTRKSIGGINSDLVQRYKKNKFYSIRLRILEQNSKVLNQAIKRLKDYSTESIHRSMPESYKNLPDICYKDDSLDEVADWVESTYKRNSYELPDDANVACDGTKTRSKGETIIYDDIKYSKIPFQYDSYHKFKGRSGKVHGISPDFLFKCKDGTLIAWEHLGLLGDGTYSQDTIIKINKYLDSGFVIGDNLIITGDNAAGNTNEIAILEALGKVKRRVLG